MLILKVALVNLVDDLLGIQEVLITVSPTSKFLSPVSLRGLVGWDLADGLCFWLRALDLFLLLSERRLLLLVRFEGFGFRKLSVLLVVHALKQPACVWVLVPRFEGVFRTYTSIHGLLDHRFSKFVQSERVQFVATYWWELNWAFLDFRALLRRPIYGSIIGSTGQVLILKGVVLTSPPAW